MVTLASLSGELLAWIADPRQSSIADYRQAVSRGEQVQQLRQATVDVVLVEREPPAFGFDLSQQGATAAGVFTGDDINHGQELARSRRKITKMSNGCSHQINSCRRRLRTLHQKGDKPLRTVSQLVA